MCFAIIGLMAAVISFSFLPASLTGNYPLGTLDYTTSPDHYKLIRSTGRHAQPWPPYGRAALHLSLTIDTGCTAYHRAMTGYYCYTHSHRRPPLTSDSSRVCTS
ncbi:hypothetical protein BDR03DRAFT_938576 [Suillus americanus]|nr:hypothetical protein BDR03DRAFT_938576 [Suillus americanus]